MARVEGGDGLARTYTRPLPHKRGHRLVCTVYVALVSNGDHAAPGYFPGKADLAGRCRKDGQARCSGKVHSSMSGAVWVLRGDKRASYPQWPGDWWTKHYGCLTGWASPNARQDYCPHQCGGSQRSDERWG